MVSYGAASSLAPLLASVATQTLRPAVRIWHNGPGPASEVAAHLAVREAQATVSGCGENLGFGEGVNRLLATSVAEAAVIANPDLSLDPRCVEALCAALEGGATVAGGALSTAGNPARVNAYRLRLTYDLLGINTDRDRPFDELLAPRPPGAPPDDADFLGPSGALFAVHRPRYAAGPGGPLFPRSLFLYLEDVALWIRLRRHGAGIVLEPQAQAVHSFSQSVGPRSAAKLYYVERNRLWLARALWGRARAAALLPFTTLRYAAYALAELRAPTRVAGHAQASRVELLRALGEAVTHGLGATLPPDLVGYLAAGRPAGLAPYFAPLGAQLRNPVA